MPRVLTNNTALQYSIEDTPGVLQQNPIWYELEPNTYGNIGSTITTVARNPISKNRQNRKGTVTDLDSTAEFEVDLTMSHFTDFAESVMFSRFDGAEVFRPQSVDAASYTVISGSTLVVNTLVFARGFTNAENNGLKLVNGTPTGTNIPVDGTLTVETIAAGQPNYNATVETAGFRTPAGDLAVTLINNTDRGTQVTITSTSNIFNNAGLNIRPGSAIYFGGSTAITNFTEANNRGYARVISIASDGSSIIIDKTSQLWVVEAGASQTVEFYIGQFLRNVGTDNTTLFIERSLQFEITYPDLVSVGTPGHEYSFGNFCNNLPINLPLGNKATLSPAFVGTDTRFLDPPSSRQPGANQSRRATRTSAFNTTQDCARLRVTDIDQMGLTTDFKSLTLTIGNSVTPEKVLCILGARYINYGNIQVTLEGQLVFTNAAVVNAVRNNQTVATDIILKNDDGALFIDIPAMTLGGGNKDFPVDASVLINVTGNAFEDPILGTSIGITSFPFIPDAPTP